MEQNDVLFQIMQHQNERDDSINSHEYLCENAELKCESGSYVSNLVLPSGYGISLRGMEQVTARDTKVQNISTFGICTKSGKVCTPLLTDWINVNIKKQLFNHNTLNREATPTVDSYAVCMAQGSLISVDTSGQLETIEDNEVPLASSLKATESVTGNVSIPGKIEYNCSNLNDGAYNIYFYSNEVEVTLKKKAYVRYKKYEYSSKLVDENGLCIKANLKAGDYRFEIDSDDVDSCNFLIEGNEDRCTEEWGSSGGQWFLTTPIETYIYNKENYSYIEKVNYLNKEDVVQLILHLYFEDGAIKNIISDNDAYGAALGAVLGDALSDVVEGPIASFLIGLLATAGINLTSFFSEPFSEKIKKASGFEMDKDGRYHNENGVKFIFTRYYQVLKGVEGGLIVPIDLIDEVELTLEPWDESRKTIYGAKYARGRFEKWEDNSAFKNNSGNDLIN